MNTETNNETNNNNQTANNNIISEVYKDVDSNAKKNNLKIGEINAGINLSPETKIEQNKQELIKQLKLKYQFPEMASKLIILKRENEQDCIFQIKSNVASYIKLSENDIEELHNYLKNFDFLNPDFGFFENNKPEAVPVQQQEEPIPEQTPEVISEPVQQEKSKDELYIEQLANKYHTTFNVINEIFQRIKKTKNPRNYDYFVKTLEWTAKDYGINDSVVHEIFNYITYDPELEKELEQPEPVQQEVQVKTSNTETNTNDEINYIPCRTNNPNIDIIITPTKKAITLQVQYKDKINGSNVKAKSISELLDVSKNFDNKIIKMLRQVTGIERKEAKKITDEFLSELGEIDSKVFERMIEKTNAFEIDYSHICDDTITKEIVEKAIDLVNDGNTKKYIVARLQENFSLDKKDSTYVVDIAHEIQYSQMISINPLDFFNDDKQSKLNVPYLVQQIMRFNHFLTIGYDGKKDIYVYQDGVYVNKGKNNIRKSVNIFLSRFVKEEFRNEVMRFIEIETGIEREQLNKNKYLINLKNGMYDIESDKLLEHDPKYHSTMRIPLTYDSNATCPNIDKFLSEVVSEENAVTLTEYLGYCLIPDVRMQRALMVFGHAGNGKSVFLNLAGKIIGKPNTSAIPLQKLAQDKFAVAGLFGMLANICPDIPANKLKTDAIFKIIVGGDDELNAEKKFMDQFDFKNYARLMFSANVLPEPAGDVDDNRAFYRRWMLVPFPNSFEGKSDNKNLIDELTTEQEKSGYLNKLLEALKIILKNGKFTYEKTPEEIEEIYKSNLASIDKFFEEHVIITSEMNQYYISKEDMYAKYCDWCKKNGAIPKHYQTFCNILMTEKGLKYKRVGKNKIGQWINVVWNVEGYTEYQNSINGITIKPESKKYDQPLYNYMDTDPELLPESRKKLNLSLDDDTTFQA